MGWSGKEHCDAKVGRIHLALRMRLPTMSPKFNYSFKLSHSTSSTSSPSTSVAMEDQDEEGDRLLGEKLISPEGPNRQRLYTSIAIVITILNIILFSVSIALFSVTTSKTTQLNIELRQASTYSKEKWWQRQLYCELRLKCPHRSHLRQTGSGDDAKKSSRHIVSSKRGCFNRTRVAKPSRR
ncbi:hypothetical protein M426DRAFT_120212 [Hypoxylon sp. CI-4A]|nr:hypothetical protein M426DRAFT_120212 [Hypoxylon sp. CI-4A]